MYVYEIHCNRKMKSVSNGRWRSMRTGDVRHGDGTSTATVKSALPTMTTSSFTMRGGGGGGGGRNLFFGDSFIRMFGLVKHQQLSVQAFKGATAKGLARNDNTNRQQIMKRLSRVRGGGLGDRATNVASRNNIDRVIFNFGNVDVHLSYYYALYGGGADEEKNGIDLVQIANDYVDFVASLFPPASESINNNSGNNRISRGDDASSSTTTTTTTTTTTKVIVLGVYPPAPEDDHVAHSLVCYGSVTEEEAVKIPASDKSMSARRGRVDAFNNALREKCLLLNEHSSRYNIHYEDATEEMTDPTTGKLRESYRDVSDQNIHVVWETTILLWMKRWPWYGRLAPRGFEADLERTLSKYLETKPWAERTHVTAEMGIGGIQAAVDSDNRRYAKHAPAQNTSGWTKERNNNAAAAFNGP